MHSAIHWEVARARASAAALDMGQAGLPPVLVRHRSLGSASLGCSLGVLISASSLPGAPWWAGTQRAVTSLLLALSLALTSVAVTANRWPGPMPSYRILSITAAEPTKMM